MASRGFPVGGPDRRSGMSARTDALKLTAAVAIGECMLELSRSGSEWRLRHAGDTFNTALYLQRLGLPTAYLTALGADPFSEEMRAAWRGEGLDTTLVLTDPERLPGLYAIRTDDAGERSFYYWRQHAAVRGLFSLPGIDTALIRASDAPLLYFTGITLSLFSEADRVRLLELGHSVRRRGGTVAFDLNYRPAGWPDIESARQAIRCIAPVVSWALPTFEDSALLFDHQSPEDTVAQWRSFGAAEVIVKLGARGCLVAHAEHDEVFPAPHVPLVVDTTGAGDAFNAGYLAARAAGLSPARAAATAQILACEVIQQPGAIVPLECMARIRQRMLDASR
jgi:2-dehydro-3-deoxygluconokinase